MFNQIINMLRNNSSKKDSYLFESYSLEGEDRLIDRYFAEKNSGFYLDIGANHPVRFNNTCIFYKKGWRGINIDADLESVKEFKRIRKEDINIHAAIGNRKKYLNYFIFNDTALNTFNKKYCDHYLKVGYKLLKVAKFKFKKLSLILSKLSIPKKIDFMSIDVEGMELEVLKSNDWKKYRPELILVEVFGKNNLDFFLNNQISKYLKLKGYIFYAKTLTNCIYKDDK